MQRRTSKRPTDRAHQRRLARIWVRAVVASLGLFFAAVIVFTIVVDPFQQYHVSSRFEPRFYSLHHRFINPGLAKHADYDTIATGSSIVENTRDEWVERYCGGKAVNLAMPAMSAYEQGLLLRTALQSRPVKRVLMTLDFNSFAGGIREHQSVAGALPLYLFDRNPLNDLAYVLSWDVLEKSWHIMRGDRTEKFTTNPKAPWYWADQRSFDRVSAVRNTDPDDLNKAYVQPRRELQPMLASFDANLLPLLQAYPKTRFDLIWPPYSILVWADFVQRRQLDVSLDFKRAVFERTRGLPNVTLVDFQPLETITRNLDLYADLYHYSPEINETIVRDTCAGAAPSPERVTSENLEQGIETLRRQALGADPRRIVSDALAGTAR
jgi:hypothetical protein